MSEIATRLARLSTRHRIGRAQGRRYTPRGALAAGPRAWFEGLSSIVLVAVFLLAAAAGPARAQGPAAGWSAPVNLSNNPTDSTFPAVAADPSGAVHVLWCENLDLNQASADTIFYTRWDGTAWSRPVDILFSPEGPQSTASDPAVAVSADGRLHLVWAGGWGDKVYYSSARAVEAGSAQAWARPAALNSAGTRPSSPDLALDGAGDLHVLYLVALDPDQGVYHLRSADGGATWSAPVVIAGSRLGAQSLLADLRLAIGPDGVLHAVWSWAEMPETFPPKGVFYARSADGGESWTEPLLLADGPYSYPAVAAVSESQIHVIYSGTADRRSKFHTWSADGGLTWSEQAAVLTPGGLQGYASLAVDSAGTLHWLTVGGHPTIADPLVHVQWDGTRWSAPEVLLSLEGLGIRINQNMANAAAAVRLGNELVAAVTVPVGEGGKYQNDIYAVRGTVDAPALAPQPLPTPALTATPAELAPAAPAPTATAAPSPTGWALGTERLPPETGGASPLLLAIGLTAAVLAAAAAAWLRWGRGR